jgi:hypothetical protein
MWTTHKALLGLLLLQSVATAATWWPSEAVSQRTEVFAEGTRFQRLVLHGRTTPDDEAEPPIVLRRDGEGWVSETHFDYPVRDDALDGLLEHLDGLAVQHPIATRAVHHRELNVADDEHLRRIEVEAGGASHTLVLGAAQGSSSHLRIDGGDEVYRVAGLSASSIPDSPSRLFERKLFDVNVDDIDSLSIERPDGSGWSVTRSDQGWTSPQLADGEAIDEPELKRILRELARTRMEEPVAASASASHGLGDGIVVRWTVDEDGASVPGGFTIGGSDGDDRRYVTVLDREHVVTVRDSGLKAARESALPSEASDALP